VAFEKTRLIVAHYLLGSSLSLALARTSALAGWMFVLHLRSITLARNSVASSSIALGENLLLNIGYRAKVWSIVAKASK
jgi:hypothetical protein